MTFVNVSTTDTVINVTVETYNTLVTPEVVSSTVVVQAISPEIVSIVSVATQGPPGPPNELEIGTVTTVPFGDPATATITGTTPNQVLNLEIPNGEKGETGLAGPGVPETGAVGQFLKKTGSGAEETEFSTIEISDVSGLDIEMADHRVRIANSLSTTRLAGVKLSWTNGGTTVSVSPGVALFVDNTDPENAVYSTVTFAGEVDIAPNYLLIGTGTFFYLNSVGELEQQPDVIINNNTKDLMAIGWVAHYNSTIDYGLNEGYIATDLASQFHNFLEALGAFNISGNRLTAIPGTLSVERSAGVIFDGNSAEDIDPTDPNRYPSNTISPVGAAYSYSDGAGDWNYPAGTNFIDPNFYDDMSGTLAAVPVGHYTIQPMYMYLDISHDMQYGQATYATVADAESALGETTVVNADVSYNILIAKFIVKSGDTDLANAKIFMIDRFGGVSSSGGGSGEVNIASNANSEGIGVWLDKLGVELRFKGLVSKDPLLTLTANVGNATIEYRYACMFNQISANIRSHNYSWTVNVNGLPDVFTYVIPGAPATVITKTITYDGNGLPTKITLAGAGLPTLTNKVKNLTLNVDGSGSVTYTPT